MTGFSQLAGTPTTGPCHGADQQPLRDLAAVQQRLADTVARRDYRATGPPAPARSPRATAWPAPAPVSSTSDFNFLFNSLPGDALRGGTVVNSTDYLDVRAKNNTTSSSTNYNPYYDVTGAGIINSTDYLDVRARNNNTLPSNAPWPADFWGGQPGIG